MSEQSHLKAGKDFPDMILEVSLTKMSRYYTDQQVNREDLIEKPKGRRWDGGTE